MRRRLDELAMLVDGMTSSDFVARARAALSHSDVDELAGHQERQRERATVVALRLELGQVGELVSVMTALINEAANEAERCCWQELSLAVLCAGDRTRATQRVGDALCSGDLLR